MNTCIFFPATGHTAIVNRFSPTDILPRDILLGETMEPLHSIAAGSYRALMILASVTPPLNRTGAGQKEIERVTEAERTAMPYQLR